MGSASWPITWLSPNVGVEACGVIWSGPSSSEELSSFIASSCRRSSSSRFLAASISARCAASLASFSFDSASAAFFFRFSSSFFSFPALTCSSRALSREAASSRCRASSSSWIFASCLLRSQYLCTSVVMEKEIAGQAYSSS